MASGTYGSQKGTTGGLRNLARLSWFSVGTMIEW